MLRGFDSPDYGHRQGPQMVLGERVSDFHTLLSPGYKYDGLDYDAERVGMPNKTPDLSAWGRAKMKNP